MDRHIVVIFGPTAVGKTEFAEKLAYSLPAEIVNMDLGQFYTPLTIGTAKPDWRSRPIPHHLFDILDTPENFNVMRFRNLLLGTLQDIWQRNKIPIIVGGSSLYAKTIFFPLYSEEQHVPTISESVSWHDLHALDPVRARAIHPRDLYRIKRAYVLIQASGRLASHFSDTYEPPSSYTFLFLTRGREELYSMINRRVSAMIQSGWLEEVKALRGTPWEPFLNNKKLIGYNELLDYLAHGSPPEMMPTIIEKIAQRTRNYAKRQNTFWRMLEKKLLNYMQQANDYQSAITAINLTLLDLDLYISQLSEQLRQKTGLR